MTPSEELIRIDTHARAHTECPLKTRGEDGHLPSGGKGLPKPALRNLDLILLASRIANK